MSENQNPAAIEMREASIGAMRDVSFIVVEDANWTVAPGEFWVIAGQQHSGKSDFLMLTAGLMAPVEGSCRLFGRDTRTFGEAELAERLRVGLVFEGGQLFNHLTIRENVALPLQYHRNLSASAAAAEIQPLLELMELTPLADITPANVSGNWLQRAALARALVLKPELLAAGQPAGPAGCAAPAMVAAFSGPAVARTRLARQPAVDAGGHHGRFASLAERAVEIRAVARQKIFPARFMGRPGSVE